MNILSIHTAQSSGKNQSAKNIFAGGLSLMQGASLKSTREKMQRRQKADGEVAFWEKKKESLKSMECGSLEEIAQKLEMFHTYEDEIAAVKASYNKEQMFHVLDEAMEQGKKNAEAAEKNKPKTPEERKEELVEEALGIEEDKGILSEVLDEVTEKAAEAAEKVSENAQELAEEAARAVAEKVGEDAEEMSGYGQVPTEIPAQTICNGREELFYKRFDMRI